MNAAPNGERRHTNADVQMVRCATCGSLMFAGHKGSTGVLTCSESCFLAELDDDANGGTAH